MYVYKGSVWFAIENPLQTASIRKCADLHFPRRVKFDHLDKAFCILKLDPHGLSTSDGDGMERKVDEEEEEEEREEAEE